jgi:tetratricopeptide (TPR) repeat protein
MSEPASGSTPPKSLNNPTATPPPPPQEFDLLAFWIQYRKVIMTCAYAVVLGLVLWAAYLYNEARKKENSELALASAKTVEEFRKVATEWTGTPAAATAQFRVADKLREEGKIDDAAKEYRDFATKNPTHPLMVGSIASLGLMYESAGKQTEALEAYSRIQTSYPNSGHVPVALLGLARIQAAQGKIDEANKTLDTLIQRGGGSPFGFNSEARRLQASIKNPNARKTGGVARPAAPATPAAAPATPAAAPATPAAAPATPAAAPATPAAAPATPAAAPATPAAAPATPAGQETAKPAQPADAPK